MAGMPRSDIYINLPALRKLDTMLLVRQARSFALVFVSNSVTFSGKQRYLVDELLPKPGNNLNFQKAPMMFSISSTTVTSKKSGNNECF